MHPNVAPAAISIPAVKQEAKFICSACGADRACDCNAPAVEKLAEMKEAHRQAQRDYKERKRQQKQSSGDITAEIKQAVAAEDDSGPATPYRLGGEHSPPANRVGKATLEEFHTAGHVIGVLEHVVHELSVLDFAKAARGCNAADVERINRNVDQVSMLLGDLEEAMGKRGPQIPDDLTIPEFMRRGVA